MVIQINIKMLFSYIKKLRNYKLQRGSFVVKTEEELEKAVPDYGVLKK